MQEDLNFWKKVIIRGFVMAGFTFFSIVATLDFSLALKPSLIAGGTYIFTEAFIYYKIQPDKKVNTKSQTKLYNFLI